MLDTVCEQVTFFFCCQVCQVKKIEEPFEEEIVLSKTSMSFRSVNCDDFTVDESVEEESLAEPVPQETFEVPVRKIPRWPSLCCTSAVTDQVVLFDDRKTVCGDGKAEVVR